MDSIMNRDALDQIVAECTTWLDSLTQSHEQWEHGYQTALQQVQQSAGPIVQACDADYGDAGGPVMNRDAQTAITVDLDDLYNDNRDTGNHNDQWLLGVAAGTQRFEMYAGDIVADCT
jgi:hypothetical protein